MDQPKSSTLYIEVNKNKTQVDSFRNLLIADNLTDRYGFEKPLRNKIDKKYNIIKLIGKGSYGSVCKA